MPSHREEDASAEFWDLDPRNGVVFTPSPDSMLDGARSEGFEKELGYFSLSELESVRGPYGVGIERDLLLRHASHSEGVPVI